MGQSVLTPKEDLLGKARNAGAGQLVSVDFIGIGGKGIRTKIPKPACGERSLSGQLGRGAEASKQLTTAGPGQPSLWRAFFSP